MSAVEYLDKVTRLVVVVNGHRIVESIGDDYTFLLQDNGQTLKIIATSNPEKRKSVMEKIEAGMREWAEEFMKSINGR